MLSLPPFRSDQKSYFSSDHLHSVQGRVNICILPPLNTSLTIRPTHICGLDIILVYHCPKHALMITAWTVSHINNALFFCIYSKKDVSGTQGCNSGSKYTLFKFSHLVSVCVCVCLSVCMSVSALQPKRLGRF